MLIKWCSGSISKGYLINSPKYNKVVQLCKKRSFFMVPSQYKMEQLTAVGRRLWPRQQQEDAILGPLSCLQDVQKTWDLSFSQWMNLCRSGIFIRAVAFELSLLLESNLSPLPLTVNRKKKKLSHQLELLYNHYFILLWIPFLNE